VGSSPTSGKNKKTRYLIWSSFLVPPTGGQALDLFIAHNKYFVKSIKNYLLKRDWKQK